MEGSALPGEVGEGFVEHGVFEQHPKEEHASLKTGCGLSSGRTVARTKGSKQESTVSFKKKEFTVSHEAGQVDIQTREEILFV